MHAVDDWLLKASTTILSIISLIYSSNGRLCRPWDHTTRERHARAVMTHEMCASMRESVRRPGCIWWSITSVQHTGCHSCSRLGPTVAEARSQPRRPVQRPSHRTTLRRRVLVPRCWQGGSEQQLEDDQDPPARLTVCYAGNSSVAASVLCRLRGYRPIVQGLMLGGSDCTVWSATRPSLR